MWNKSKYVVGIPRGSRFKQAVIIPETMNHRDLRPIFAEILSAGFWHIANDKIVVYGESTSLGGVRCNPDTDPELIGQAISHPEYVA